MTTSQTGSAPVGWTTPRFIRVAEYYGTLFRNFWRGSIVTIFISPVLYLVAMGLGVGSLVDANVGTALEGTPYLHYVAPGLLASAAMQTGVGASMYPVLASVKWLRTGHGIAATPVRPVDIALGMQAWLAVQLFVAATVFVAVMAVAGAIDSVWVVAAPVAAVLCGLAYASLLAAWAISRETDDSFSLIFRLGILPSFLLSGTFFPIEQLPLPLQVLATISPLWHGVELARGFTTGGATLGAALAHAAVLVVYISAGLLLAGREYTRRLHP